ncbi:MULTISPECIES: tRNA preQ1(34) S-adenosylmethionine ribosyltransferase-isomerase QueA [unclassified Roseofilum]|uniref:tRNA preQ1(34) S-adenosylmethionine ribosyltransferase-isomerase QueA n=1 Tax=unclassified Roseofilum TaxID=2620099 RepID=UPI001B27A1D4|nr:MULTISPECIES: tRNA preQ1(34) S-adenosylmethionine ribosyltransferase-isomerase QueA [unclassified Roseofilum]MBP0007488.1 tRNA preQ1(34) S-adenosylmethionine ribosyltransferase-isomerase QueA [Roseofilum sp. Belize Diploria]MBP0031766.1 tRNA preQ1(34) S-adenosylmethionine ribosyltransferase-isomerase QueA [Roseofilum sp. Belize BBD 4]
MDRERELRDDRDYDLNAYDYILPEECIAQNPVTPRDSSRLLVVDSSTGCHHGVFCELPQWLRRGDLLVINNTRVIPARLYGYKSTGMEMEALLLERVERHVWLALVKPGRRLKPGAVVEFSAHGGEDLPPLKAKIRGTDEATGGRFLEFELSGDRELQDLLDDYGHVPFPPYVTDTQAEADRYQTVYAQAAGSVAAPTAGLHFTPRLLEELEDLGIERAMVTLHVGVGTFRPVEVKDIRTHQMHQEWLEVSGETWQKVRETQKRGGRVISVGTTSVRALEGAAHWWKSQDSLDADSVGSGFYGKTDLFIYPGYEWQVVEGLITNFHLPCSSLLMLVSALVGRSRLLQLYQEAIAEDYRFYSFGDAMLILPDARL